MKNFDNKGLFHMCWVERHNLVYICVWMWSKHNGRRHNTMGEWYGNRFRLTIAQHNLSLAGNWRLLRLDLYDLVFYIKTDIG